MFIGIPIVYHLHKLENQEDQLRYYDMIQFQGCVHVYLWDGMVSIFASYQKLSFVCKLYPREELKYGANNLVYVSGDFVLQYM